MIIFDRWGNLIFNETSTNPTWAGFNMLNNTDCPQGTYVYKIKVKNIFQEDSAYTGTVTLIR
jgi:gliding motility-associated-like protein